MLKVEIDPLKFTIIEKVIRATTKLNIETCLIGATARDVYFHYLHKNPIERATEDFDLSLLVSWKKYTVLMDFLCDSGDFCRDSSQVQRVKYIKNDKKTPFDVDLVPYGPAVEKTEGLIEFPNSHGTRMTTWGFQEAKNSSLEILLNGKLTIHTLSLAGLLTTKLKAWNDRRELRDAFDIKYIFENSFDTINQDEFFDKIEIIETLIEEETIQQQIVAFLALKINDEFPNSKKRILEVLGHEVNDNSKLIQSMLSKNISTQKDYQHYLTLLEILNNTITKDCKL